MKISKIHTNFTLYMVLLAILILRGVTLEVTELIDPTETRYATISANMLESHDYVIPRLYSGDKLDPYFSKPPLHFWLTSIAFKIFGVDEWTARLVSFLSLIAISFCLIKLGEKIYDKKTGLIAAIICASSPLIFFMSGGSHVDMTLSAFITLALTAFSLRINSNDSKTLNDIYSATFFIATAFSFLTKGPVGLVLIFLPIAIWILITKSFFIIKMPSWKIGIILFAIITLPWFYFAEKASPGFLKYYFVNENYLRYVTHDYGGHHGANHTRPYGYIWILLLLGTIPWSLIGLRGLISEKQFILSHKIQENKFAIFCLIWGLTPAIFFSISSSILPAYVLPGIPGLAFCLAILAKKIDSDFMFETKFLKKLSILEAILLTMIFATPIIGLLYFKNKSLIMISSELILTLTLISLFKFLKMNNDLTKFVRIGLIQSILFTVVILTISPQLGKTKSADGILNYIADSEIELNQRIAVLETGNQSPFWTALAWRNELSRKVQVMPVTITKLEKSKIKNLIQRTKHNKELPRIITRLFIKRKSIGEWTWFVRKNINSING